MIAVKDCCGSLPFPGKKLGKAIVLRRNEGRRRRVKESEFKKKERKNTAEKKYKRNTLRKSMAVLNLHHQPVPRLAILISLLLEGEMISHLSRN
jgi:hypothetical protein